MLNKTTQCCRQSASRTRWKRLMMVIQAAIYRQHINARYFTLSFFTQNHAFLRW
jgi:hypothetical protein